jgi:YVTN family beta-propeller protein
MSYRIEFLLVFLSCACSLPSTAQTLVTDIPVSGYPYGVAVNPSTNRIYASVVPPNNGTPEVAVIDGASNTVIDTISTPKGAQEMAVNLTTNRVYAAGCTSTQCALTVIDGNSDKVLGTIPITANQGIGIQGLAVNPVTNRIYLSDATDAKVDVIDGNTNKIVNSISLGGGQPLGLAVDFGTNQIAIALNGPYLYIASGVTDKVVGRVTIGQFAANVAVNSFTSQAYVTNETFAPSTIAVVNLKNGQVEANISVGNNPFGVCVDLYTNLVFVTNTQDSTVAVVNGNSRTKIGSVSANSFLIDVNPATRMVYATDGSGSVVHVISE